jgi:hypothetical protein
MMDDDRAFIPARSAAGSAVVLVTLEDLFT